MKPVVKELEKVYDKAMGAADLPTALAVLKLVFEYGLAEQFKAPKPTQETK